MHEKEGHSDRSKFFEKICGATLVGSRSHKEDVIRYLLAQVTDVSDVIMVGDTAYDVIGAAAHSIPCIGVSWGYGTQEDMKNAGAAAIAQTPEEVIQIVNR